MVVFWKIRYVDTRHKQFKDRELWLDTDELDPAVKAEVELYFDTRDGSNERKILQYRHLFTEREAASAEMDGALQNCDRWSAVSVSDYLEDENGRELTDTDAARILTGNPDTVVVPPGAKQHDLDYMLADKPPVPLEELSLTNEQLTLFGYFSRDLRELSEAAFMKDSPGIISNTASGPGGARVSTEPVLETAATDEEIRSFLTIFRRLYMQGDAFNFLKTAKAASDILGDHPLGKWIAGAAREYETTLTEAPYPLPFFHSRSIPFSRKRLIDVFLYTQYAHQPKPDRIRQFQECLEAVGNRRGILTWLFLATVWECGGQMICCGRPIVALYNRYCERRGVKPTILESVGTDHPGIGTQEKRQARDERVLGEKAEQLARDIWEAKGRPAGGHAQFVPEARDQLKRTME